MHSTSFFLAELLDVTTAVVGLTVLIAHRPTCIDLSEFTCKFQIQLYMDLLVIIFYIQIRLLEIYKLKNCSRIE